MKFLNWVLCLSLLMAVLAQAVVFHKATVCRQKVWLKSLELRTRETLSESRDLELHFLSKCETQIIRKLKSISCIKGNKLTAFEVLLKGKL